MKSKTIFRVILYAAMAASIYFLYPYIDRFGWRGYSFHKKAGCFDYYTDFSKAEAEKYLSLFVHFRHYFEQRYFKVDDGDKVRMYLFATPQSYLKFCKKARYSPAQYGFYLPRKKLIAINTATGLGTILHEVAHHFLAATGGKYPYWFEEGFAAYFEKFIATENPAGGEVDWMTFGYFNPWRFEEVMQIKGNDRISLEEMLTAGECPQSLARNFILFTHYQGLLPRLTERMRSGQGSIQAVEAVFGQSLSLVEYQWNSWIEQHKASGDWGMVGESRIMTEKELEEWKNLYRTEWDEKLERFVPAW